MRNFKSVRFAWSKEILNGVVMCKAAKPKNHDFEYTVLVKGKRPQQHVRQKCRDEAPAW